MRIAALSLALLLAEGALAQGLPKLKIEPEGITVSGISSGGYMANQFHLAHAEAVHGVGIIAAGPYDCAENSLVTALARCFDKPDSAPPVAHLLATAKSRAVQGELAALDLVKDDAVWLFHGTRDATVARPVAEALRDFYVGLVTPDKLVYVDAVAAGHGFPTEKYGKPCAAHEEPFINACGFDAAGQLLNHVYGPLRAPVEPAGELRRYAQDAYAPDGKATLAEEGFLYLPQACAAGKSCRLHVVFHGCRQNAEALGETFVREAGYNRWAESNDIVVLYPQTKASMLPMNPKACWDWWGYTGADYATKHGSQIRTVWAMVKALRGQ